MFFAEKLKILQGVVSPKSNRNNVVYLDFLSGTAQPAAPISRMHLDELGTDFLTSRRLSPLGGLNVAPSGTVGTWGMDTMRFKAVLAPST